MRVGGKTISIAFRPSDRPQHVVEIGAGDNLRFLGNKSLHDRALDRRAMATIDSVWHVPAKTLLGPPPPGLDVNHSRTTTDNVACVTLVVITAIVVAIRFFVLIQVQRSRPFLDDWLMLINLVSSPSTLSTLSSPLIRADR